MKTYKIACDWSVYGVIYVEANSLKEAIEKAKNDDELPLPPADGYIDSSFQVNEEMTEYFLKEGN